MIVAGDPIASDGMIIGYPNNTQATANILNCSADTMEISLNGQSWHLKLQTSQLGNKKFVCAWVIQISDASESATVHEVAPPYGTP
jgi:hypothetical protein